MAQNGDGKLEGRVTEVNEDGELLPLTGANIYWLGTTTGTISDELGHFSIARVEGQSRLIVSFIGFENDTLSVTGDSFIEIQLSQSTTLDEVKVIGEQKSTEVDFLNPRNVQLMDEKELLKAACCNLSESFETSPSVDVAFTDAITGTRQIQMLGLAGPYTQILRENMPHVRGLASTYGLTFVPGTWVSGIQLNKGTGSVFNGFESIAGQINVEMKKPEEAERLNLNIYGNEGGRFEANANFIHRFDNGKWSTALLMHTMQNSRKNDRNEDGFLDMPLSKHYIGLNRWNYTGDKGLRLQFGVKATYTSNQGGEMDFDPEVDAMTTNLWGMELDVRRLEGWMKIGQVFEDMPWKSTGLQLSASTHTQESYFGLNQYDAEQQSFYANWVYQSIFSNTNHIFRTGASFQYDKYDEVLNNQSLDRTEVVPGAYFEYTYQSTDKFSAVAGIRADYNNLYGGFVTPRLHLRYALRENTILRASAGRGQRTANIIAENNRLLASSRQIVIEGDGSDKPYGLDAEVSWNYGMSLSQYFQLDYREGIITFDFYRTDFQNQIVIDVDQSPQNAFFYNLDGQSYANSFQVQVDYELINRLDLRMAYRWYDVKTTFRDELRQQPLVSSHRAFLNLAYETRSSWKFDGTMNWQGQKRIPFTGSNPEEYQLPSRSPDFFVVNAQVTKTWLEKVAVYAGVENLLNFRQDDPILASDEPFGPYFDSSLVWGPVFGRNIYMGVRYIIR